MNTVFCIFKNKGQKKFSVPEVLINKAPFCSTLSSVTHLVACLLLPDIYPGIFKPWNSSIIFIGRSCLILCCSILHYFLYSSHIAVIFRLYRHNYLSIGSASIYKGCSLKREVGVWREVRAENKYTYLQEFWHSNTDICICATKYHFCITGPDTHPNKFSHITGFHSH